MFKLKNQNKYILFLILIVITIPISYANTPDLTYYPSLSLSGSTQDSSFQVNGFSSNTLLSTDDSNWNYHVEPMIAISDNGTLFVGWKNANSHNGGGEHVSIVKSINRSVSSWTVPFDMPMYNGLSTKQSDPWLVWHNQSIYYAYIEWEPEYFQEFNNSYLSQVTVAKSGGDLTDWTTTNASNGLFFADKETMTIDDNGIIYMVYDDADASSPEGNVTIRFTRSIDKGESFKEVSIIGVPSDGHLAPYITLDSENNITIVSTWLDIQNGGGNLYYTSSNDGGFTFKNQTFINTDGNYSFFGSGKVTIPVIRFDQHDRLYLLWADTYENNTHSLDVYLRYSDDFGITWSNRFQVNLNTAGDQWMPDMDIDSDGNLHIVYYNASSNGNFKPNYCFINFTGEYHDNPVINPPIAIADEETLGIFTRPGDYLTVRLDQNDIPHVVWTDGRNNELDIYYAYGIQIISEPTPESNQKNAIGIELEVILTVGFVSIIVMGVLVSIKRRKTNI
ncbi:hypothetical protein LCGC14_1265200 [marine sediment metagenome]|uniref:Sialidase domain-containing protein n=1 Tax=marine sediment metagenome TaxID=412755 RepID=A0A0F9LKT3_9ZZZZ|nr:exo-alpha-sialidase [archaeon]